MAAGKPGASSDEASEFPDASSCNAPVQCRRIFRHTMLDALEQCRRVAVDVPDISALVFRGDARTTRGSSNNRALWRRKMRRQLLQSLPGQRCPWTCHVCTS